MTLKEFRERTKDLPEDYRIEFSTNGENGICWPEVSVGLYIREMDDVDEKPRAVIIV